MPTISYVLRAAADAGTRAVYEEIMRTYGLDEPRGIYLLMGHTPTHLAGSWPRSRHCYGRDSSLTMKEKHLLTLAISAANNCEYCVRSHTVRLRQLETSDRELVELLAVVHSAVGCARLAEGVRLGDDPTIPASTTRVEPRASDVRRRLATTLGQRAADDLLAVLAPGESLAETVVGPIIRCFGEDGELGRRFKHMVGLCVSACNGSDYFVDVHTRCLRDLAVTDSVLVEVVFLVDVVCGYNRYVQGLQVNPREGEKPWGAHAEANAAPSCCA
jgi:AhpD family alkylhydroperoxidase